MKTLMYCEFCHWPWKLEVVGTKCPRCNLPGQDLGEHPSVNNHNKLLRIVEERLAVMRKREADRLLYGWRVTVDGFGCFRGSESKAKEALTSLAEFFANRHEILLRNPSEKIVRSVLSGETYHDRQ